MTIVIGLKKDGKVVELSKTDKLRLMSDEQIDLVIDECKARSENEDNLTKFTPRGFKRIPLVKGNGSICIHPNGTILNGNLERVNYYKGEDGEYYILIDNYPVHIGELLTQYFDYSLDALRAFKKGETLAGKQYLFDEGKMEVRDFKELRKYDLLVIDDIITVEV